MDGSLLAPRMNSSRDSFPRKQERWVSGGRWRPQLPLSLRSHTCVRLMLCLSNRRPMAQGVGHHRKASTEHGCCSPRAHGVLTLVWRWVALM